MRVPNRLHISLAAVLGCAAIVAGCTSSGDADDPTIHQPSSTSVETSGAPTTSGSSRRTANASPARPSGVFTLAFAGDVHFADRVGKRLANNPATVFAQATPGLRRADLTMVNLETAITIGGEPQNKAFTFRAPPSAFTALRDAGIDVATMANNHGADYGSSGLHDTLAAIDASHFPVVGIGPNDDAAFAPYTTTSTA